MTTARPFTDLGDSGLLWLINHDLLRPRGVALNLCFDKGIAVGWSLLTPPDGWKGSHPDVDATGRRRAEATLTAAGATNAPQPPTLPPFSGDTPRCPTCRYDIARTTYRGPLGPWATQEVNDRLRRGPLPERLERQCDRCDYRWDEALPTDNDEEEGRPLTVEDLAHALDNSTPYPVELSTEACRYMAEQLLRMARVHSRPQHPVWEPQGPPTPGPQPTPGPVDQDQETGDTEQQLRAAADALEKLLAARPYGKDLPLFTGPRIIAILRAAADALHNGHLLYSPLLAAVEDLAHLINGKTS